MTGNSCTHTRRDKNIVLPNINLYAAISDETTSCFQTGGGRNFASEIKRANRDCGRHKKRAAKLLARFEFPPRPRRSMLGSATRWANLRNFFLSNAPLSEVTPVVKLSTLVFGGAGGVALPKYAHVPIYFLQLAKFLPSPVTLYAAISDS